jgi:hypothetical protein
MDQVALQRLIDAEVAQFDQPYFIITGHFLAWYAIVEMHLSVLIAMLSGVHDFEVFQILTKGMDARVKLERLRQLAKAKSGIGPNLKLRLDSFEKTIIPRRNRLSHAAPWINENEAGKFHLITIANFSEAFAGPGWDASSLNEVPKPLYASELIEMGKWLRYFSVDLGKLQTVSALSKMLEIESPHSPPPKESRSDQPRSRPRATRHKPPRKS